MWSLYPYCEFHLQDLWRVFKYTKNATETIKHKRKKIRAQWSELIVLLCSKQSIDLGPPRPNAGEGLGVRGPAHNWSLSQAFRSSSRAKFRELIWRKGIPLTSHDGPVPSKLRNTTPASPMDAWAGNKTSMFLSRFCSWSPSILLGMTFPLTVVPRRLKSLM